MAISMLIITGQSGSGKSTALHALEDQGYFCVDNLPTSLVEPLIQKVEQDGMGQRLALVMDIRERHFTYQAPALIHRLRQGPHGVQLIFLAAQDEMVMRRYSATRRLHPLEQGMGLHHAMVQERGMLSELEELADVLLDTSLLSPHGLATWMGRFGTGDGLHTVLRVRMVSFGFKNGLPVEADMVWDVRFLKNPYFKLELRDLTGQDNAVRQFVLNVPEAQMFLKHAYAFLNFLLPEYHKEGKRYLTLAVGCTGGRHRSVVLASELASRLRHQGQMVDLQHRDLKGATA